MLHDRSEQQEHEHADCERQQAREKVDEFERPPGAADLFVDEPLIRTGISDDDGRRGRRWREDAGHASIIDVDANRSGHRAEFRESWGGGVFPFCREYGEN